MQQSQTVLAIGAHPDDIEFGCGATMAKLSAEGARLVFAVCTDGNRGSRQHHVNKRELVADRHQEQLDAAKRLGADDVIFLDEEDGNLVPDIRFKERIVRLIRQVKPAMVFTHDPDWYYFIDEEGKGHVNHTDHRACGAAVIDAVYPLARDLQSFPEHIAEGLDSHKVPELYLFSYGRQPNYGFEVADYVDTQIAAICDHQSQIDDPDWIKQFITKRHQRLASQFGHQLSETFSRIVFD